MTLVNNSVPEEMTLANNFVTDLLDEMFRSGASALHFRNIGCPLFMISGEWVKATSAPSYTREELEADMEAIGIKITKTEHFNYLYYSYAIRLTKETLSVSIHCNPKYIELSFTRKK